MRARHFLHNLNKLKQLVSSFVILGRCINNCLFGFGGARVAFTKPPGVKPPLFSGLLLLAID